MHSGDPEQAWRELEGDLYRAITGGRSPRTEGDFHGALDELHRAAGSITELGRRLGVPRKTVADWLNKGVLPNPSKHPQARQDVLEALRRHRLRLGRERRLRGGGVTVHAKQRYNDGRWQGQARTWTHPPAGQYNIGWDSRANGRIIDAYLAGDMRAAAEAFIEGITDDGYQEMTDPDNAWDDVHFDIDSIELE